MRGCGMGRLCAVKRLDGRLGYPYKSAGNKLWAYSPILKDFRRGCGTTRIQVYHDGRAGRLGAPS